MCYRLINITIRCDASEIHKLATLVEHYSKTLSFKKIESAFMHQKFQLETKMLLLDELG